ncbi:MAG: UDP-2,4-diacetamido-2,4,6-trideoxy-beta-L-altropyranose hydrolase [Agathobacter sp.]
MIYIRTDMNKTIATGHVMRCLAIADAARNCGEETTFIIADEQAVQLLEERGYSSIILHTVWNDMESELPAMEQVIRENKISRLLVDSYQVTDHYLMSLRKLVKLFYLDDLNAFHYPVHALICYANYWKKFRYEEQYSDTELYLGIKYVPLRQAFSDCPKKKIALQIDKLLILSGGTDPYGVMDELLVQLNHRQYKRIDVICGRYNGAYNGLYAKYAEESNIQIHSSVADVDRYMRNADLAVSAGGTTLYELCACGTPAISYSFADNQLDNARQFQEDNLIDYAGDARYQNIAQNLVELVEKYQNDYELRKDRSESMKKMIDGKGALRLAQILISEG